MAALAALGIMSRSAPADTVAWAFNQGGAWENPVNWTNSTLPGSSDDVVIDQATGSDLITLSGGNWSVNSLLSDDQFALYGGQVAVAQNATFNGGLTVSGGALSGSGSTTFAGATNWTGGTITGSGLVTVAPGATLMANTDGGMTLGSNLTNNGTLALSGSQQAYLHLSSGVTLTNNGTMTLTDGASLYGDGPSTIQNNGTVTVGGSGTTHGNTGGALVFNNNAGGTVTVSDPASTFFQTFNNNGSVTVTSSGDLGLINGTSTGSFSLTAPGSLTAFNYTFAPGTTVTGSGTGWMYSGTTQVNVPWTLAGVTTVYGGAIANFNQPVSGPVTVSNLQGVGTANFNAAVTVAPTVAGGVANFNAPYTGMLNLQGGTANFNASATLNGGNWTGGTLAGTGTVALASGTAMSINTDNGMTLGANLTNNGTLALSGSEQAYLHLSSGVTLTNNGTMTLTEGSLTGDGPSRIQNNGTFISNGPDVNNGRVSGSLVFNNNPGGTVTASDPGTTIFQTFNNNGSVTVPAGGDLELLNGTSTGSFVVSSSNGLTVFNYNFAPGTRVSGSGVAWMYNGKIQVNVPWMLGGVTTLYGGATASFNAGGTGPILIDDATVTFAGPANSPAFASVTNSGGTLNVAGTLNVNRLMLQGGTTTTVQGGSTPGQLNVGAGGLTLASGASITLAADAASPGTLVLDGAASFTNNSGTDSIATSAVGTGQTAGTVDLDGGVPTLTVAAGGTAAISARIVDGGFVKAGNGTLVLSNAANSLNGAITVQSGTLQLTTASQITGGITVSFSGPNVGVLLVDSDTELGAASNALTLAGGTFMASSSFTTARSIILGNPAGDGTFAVATGNTLTLNGAVSGTAGLVAAGPGTLELNAPMSTGQTQITGGTLLLGPNGDLSRSYLVTVDSGATLDLGSQSRTIQALAGAGTISLGAGTLTIADPGSANATIFSGTISRTGGVSRSGPGSLTLSGNNSFTGGLTAAGGATVYLAGASSFKGGISASGGATVSASSDAAMGDPTNGISLSNATLQATASFSTARPIAVSPSGGFISVSAASSLLASGLLSGPGPTTVTGGGTLRITAAASLSGPVAITAGTLALSGSGSVASVPSFTIAAHSTLLLDDSTASGGNAGGSRLGSSTSVIVSSGGGEVQLLGANGMASSESLGTLTLGSGQTTVSITDGTGNGSSATLAFAGLVRRPGADVNFEAADGSVLGGTDRVTFLSYPYQPGPMPSWANVEEPNGTLVPAAYDPTLGVEPASAYVPPGGDSSQAESVPEPGPAGLLAVAAMGALWRKKRRVTHCREGTFAEPRVRLSLRRSSSIVESS